jgi:hypothetical protein
MLDYDAVSSSISRIPRVCTGIWGQKFFDVGDLTAAPVFGNSSLLSQEGSKKPPSSCVVQRIFSSG